MSYKVKEIYYTLQGEGAMTGRPAVFCRFSGCNLWSGREQDREKAICKFCDTNFWGTDGVNGGTFKSAKSLAEKVKSLWPKRLVLSEVEVKKGLSPSLGGKPYVVCTGGEPSLQLDTKMVNAFHKAGFEVAIETNGTKPLPEGIDWICMSPKANTEIVITKGNELKLVYPQKGIQPKDFENMDYDEFFLQPMDSPTQQENIKACLEYCMKNPQWRLSLQTHKILDID